MSLGDSRHHEVSNLYFSTSEQPKQSNYDMPKQQEMPSTLDLQ